MGAAAVNKLLSTLIVSLSLSPSLSVNDVDSAEPTNAAADIGLLSKSPLRLSHLTSRMRCSGGFSHLQYEVVQEIAVVGEDLMADASTTL